MTAETALRLEFPRRLYSAKAVKKAAKSFSEDAALTVEKTSGGLLVTGKPHDPELSGELTDELFNAALYFTLEEKKQW